MLPGTILAASNLQVVPSGTVGSMKHRLFQCSRLEECEGRRLQEALRPKGAEAGQDDPFWTELVPIGLARPVRAESTTFEWIGEEMVFTGEVFGDGSAKGLEGLKRGGSAFGQLKYSEEEELWSHGDLSLEGGWCTLEGEDHTSAEAELNAFLQVVERALPPLHYITDSMLIVRGVRAGEAWTTRVSEVQADWWRKIWKAAREWPQGTLRASHVKAHRSKEVLVDLSEEGKRWWHGNRLVDIWAGRAADKNQVDSGLEEEVKQTRKNYLALAKWAGIVNKECAVQKPWAREGVRWKVFNEVSSEERWRLPRHNLVKYRGGIKCTRCPSWAATEASRRRLKALPCLGSTIHRASAFARTLGGDFKEGGHLLCISAPTGVNTGDGIVWCTRCGAYGEKVARGLLRRCKGYPTRMGKWVIGKFGKNKHPVDGRVLLRAIPYLPIGGREAHREEDAVEGGGHGGSAAVEWQEWSGGEIGGDDPRPNGRGIGARPRGPDDWEDQIDIAEKGEEEQRRVTTMEGPPPIEEATAAVRGGGTPEESGARASAQGLEDWELEQEREDMQMGGAGLTAFEEPPVWEEAGGAEEASTSRKRKKEGTVANEAEQQKRGGRRSRFRF